MNAPSQHTVDNNNTTGQQAVSVSTDSDIEVLRTAFNRLLDDIVKYLAPDVFLIQLVEAQQATDNDNEQNVLDEAKANVLMEYLRLKDCENEVTTFSAIGYSIFALTWIVVGITLNISTSNAGFIQGLITVLVFSILLGGKITDLVRRVHGVSRRLFIDSIALQKLREQVIQRRGTAVQLTQVRRGATGLVEEGQL